MRSGKASANVAHAYVAPALIALAVLSFYPIVYGIWLSFTDAHQSRLGQESFIGLTNFVEVFTSPGFGRVTLFTIIWSVANVTAHVGFGLMLALVLTKAHLKGKLFYRTILLMPWAIPAYISILAWKGILQTDGLFNNILGTEIELLSQVTSAQVLVILVNIWLGIPFMMMSLSGALMAIPGDMYEAADLDGVSKWDQFIHLTLPNLKSTITPLSLLGFIWSFNMFTVIYLITRGNPSVDFGQPGATDILITYVYDVAFDYGRYGVAAAWSVIIFLMLVAFSWVYVKKTKATEAVA
nr:sugar ABC transporter permease [Pseudomaricurvus alkylphenolicus]